jgi:hypothetical protein
MDKKVAIAGIGALTVIGGYLLLSRKEGVEQPEEETKPWVEDIKSWREKSSQFIHPVKSDFLGGVKKAREKLNQMTEGLFEGILSGTQLANLTKSEAEALGIDTSQVEETPEGEYAIANVSYNVGGKTYSGQQVIYRKSDTEYQILKEEPEVQAGRVAHELAMYLAQPGKQSGSGISLEEAGRINRALYGESGYVPPEPEKTLWEINAEKYGWI